MMFRFYLRENEEGKVFLDFPDVPGDERQNTCLEMAKIARLYHLEKLGNGRTAYAEQKGDNTSYIRNLFFGANSWQLLDIHTDVKTHNHYFVFKEKEGQDETLVPIVAFIDRVVTVVTYAGKKVEVKVTV